MFTSYQKTITVVLAAIGLICMTFSCRKTKEAAPAVEDEAIITILSPANDAKITSGQALHIKASVKSPVTLHGYTWKLTNKADGSILAEQEEHTHGKELTIEETWDWASHIRQETSATLEITVTIDHDGNATRKSADIVFQP